LLAIDEIFSALLTITSSSCYRITKAFHIFMEAMASGLVPICTKTRKGALEIIEHNVNGLLVTIVAMTSSCGED